MLKWIEATGRSEDAAIQNALAQLGLDRDSVSVEVLERARSGFLGIGSSPAKVKVTYEVPDEEPAAPAPQPVQETPAPQPAPPAAEPQPAPQAPEAPVQEETVRPQPEAVPPAKAGELEDRVRAFLTGLLEQMGVQAKVVIAPRGENGIFVTLEGPKLGALIGHRGETLDAMQYLTSLAVNRNRKEEGYTRVTLDTEGYREKREETLARLARKIAGQVKASGRPRELEPMNPYERRVLHASLQNNPYVVTHSEGEEPNRRVVISPKPREARKEQRPSKEKQQRLVEEVETVEIIRPAGDASDPTQEQE